MNANCGLSGICVYMSFLLNRAICQCLSSVLGSQEGSEKSGDVVLLETFTQRLFYPSLVNPLKAVLLRHVQLSSDLPGILNLNQHMVC